MDRPDTDPADIESYTWLLGQVDESQRASLTRMFPLIYDDLRRVARRYMDGENAGHTLQPTALVNEAFMRVHERGVSVRGEGHALALAAIAMRRILVDHARRRSALKRGGAARPFVLTGAETSDHQDMELLELDELITRLAELDPRRARVVELKFFAGMTNDEIAAALGVARSTIAEDWSVARAWLRTQVRGSAGE